MDKAKQSEADFQTAVMTQLALIEERARSPGGYFPRPRLFYHGEPIILLDDVVTGLDVSEKTIRRYRDAGKITVYESREGNYNPQNETCNEAKTKCVKIKTKRATI